MTLARAIPQDLAPRGERSFQRLLRRTRTRADRLRWANLIIYDHLSRPVRADGPYENAGVPWFEEISPRAPPAC